MAKIDFLNLKREYLGTNKSFNDIAQENQINASYLRRRAAEDGWTDEKETIQQDASKIVTKNIAENLAEINTRHTNIWKLLQGEGLKKVQQFRDAREVIPDETLKSLAQVLKVAVEGERLSVGLPTQGIQAQVVTPVKDPYEEQLKSMTKEQLIGEIEETLQQIKSKNHVNYSNINN